MVEKSVIVPYGRTIPISPFDEIAFRPSVVSQVKDGATGEWGLRNIDGSWLGLVNIYVSIVYVANSKGCCSSKDLKRSILDNSLSCEGLAKGATQHKMKKCRLP